MTGFPWAFTKMHGLGNDFVVLEAASDAAVPDAALWRRLADRHTGIGFDQAFVVLPPRSAGADVYWRIFNADGGEVEQCGNGARCVAEWLRLAGRAGDDGARLVAAKGRELIERHRNFGALDEGEGVGRIAREGVVDVEVP